MKYLFYLLILICVFVVGCAVEKPPEQKITNFEECIAAGNPAMESYPRQCRAGDKTFTEVISHVCTPEEKIAEICTMDYNPVCGDNGKTYANGCTGCSSGEIDSWTLGECDKDTERLTFLKAMDIARSSECVEKGKLTDNYMYNENTRTWWIDLDMKPEFENELCNPACVIFEETKAVEINWRCTGALPP